MKNGFIRLIVLVSCMVVSIIMPAQDLPVLPSDAAVKCAVQPDGLTCYAVSNSIESGFADFMLLRRTYEAGDSGLVWKNENVRISDETVTDSLLITIMKKVEETADPANHAVIISGDINASKILDKLRYMSYMIDSSEPVPVPDYIWKGDSSISCTEQCDSLKNLTRINMHWKAPRTPYEYMNTVQTVVYEKAVYEFGVVAERWISRYLQDADIPYADISFSHKDSNRDFLDESFDLTVTVSSDDALQVKELLYKVLANIDAYGALDFDLRCAESRYLQMLREGSTGNFKTNAEYLELCRRSYLYNSSLTLAGDRLKFFESKELSDSVRSEVFKGITSALIDVEASPDTSVASQMKLSGSDTLAFWTGQTKIKLRSVRKEPLSGGIIWTYSNGFRVIYKKMQTDDVMHYSLALNGGYADIADIEEGEGPFISDYLYNCRYNGIRADKFMDMLSVAGLTMKPRVNLSNTMISGQVLDNDVDLLMNTLLTIAQGTSPDPEMYEYYMKCEEMRLLSLPYNVRATVDSLMSPNFRYTQIKKPGGLTDRTMEKSEAFFKEQMSKMNDGVLVLVGNMDENKLRKILYSYVGGFDTRNVAFMRSTIKYQPVSGRSTYHKEGDRDALMFVNSALYPMTAENHAACEVAAIYLQQVFDKRFASDSLAVSVAHTQRISPRERFRIMVRFDCAPGYDITNELLWNLRVEMAKLADNKMPDDELARIKTSLKNKVAAQKKNPSYWLSAIAMRHLDGKDFTTGYESKIESLDPEKIRNVFAALDDGSKIEYVMSTNSK